ncbi:uncharacterized protein GGS22DRAFT_152222 [Annulohypoxylon maeteangense]|uniref:uncharacterized protein n=1 Tax=Annulohypoxylon maeteangense TaxID=1927788 RepID=UPI0020075630|nr:uncharacterized protein GGS22DRAFT_152222 [Annulohypoxylon maeteangense]KAI0888724.1 hypothetical protein GGS22DRAFT_152222 [Annulohypoxylon maeteangense]
MAPYNTSMRFPTAVLIVNSCGLALAFFAVLLRFWARYIRRVKVRLCDYMIVASWLFSFGLVVSENYCITKGGIGQKVIHVTEEELLFSTKQFLVVDVCGSLAVAFVKISILDFLLSVFSTHNRFRIAAYVLMAATTGYGISFLVASLASCTPFEANWDKTSYPNYHCINTSYFYVAQAAIGVTLDCLILFLPVPVVWTLSLKISKKIALTVLFTIGILICVISITRLVYNTRAEWMVTHFTEYGGIACLLGALEANLSIICACLPTMQPLMTSFTGRVKSSFSSDAGGLKGLYNNFSSRYLRPVPGSMKIGSSTDRRATMYIEDDLESARLQKHVDKLYPLNTTLASRTSLSEEIGWTQQTRCFTQVDSANSKSGDESVELAKLGEKVEPYSAINVTKSWKVNSEE